VNNSTAGKFESLILILIQASSFIRYKDGIKNNSLVALNFCDNLPIVSMSDDLLKCHLEPSHVLIFSHNYELFVELGLSG